jgi:hypothetical protein
MLYVAALMSIWVMGPQDDSLMKRLNRCAAVANPTQRLACYDELSLSKEQEPPKEAMPAPTRPTGAAGCIKEVFERFCLGGDLKSLPPNPVRKDSDSMIWAMTQPTFVFIVEGRVGAVGRLYAPGTWLSYRDVLAQLVEKYGPGNDLSHFPSYADDDSSRETAIAVKKGRAARQWKEEGFTIELKWEDRDHVMLIYWHNELEAEAGGQAKGPVLRTPLRQSRWTSKAQRTPRRGSAEKRR